MKLASLVYILLPEHDRCDNPAPDDGAESSDQVPRPGQEDRHLQTPSGGPGNPPKPGRY